MKYIILTFYIALAFLSCKQTETNATVNDIPTDSTQVSLTYLGTAGWQITDGKTVILVDPYLSRIRQYYPDGDSVSTSTSAIRKAIGLNDVVVVDSLAIDSIIKRADYILVHHSHRDHIMDVPYIAKKTGAKVIGHESTANVLRAYGVPEDQIYTVKGGEDYDFGTFSVRVIPSLHSPLDDKKYFDSRVFPNNKKAPLRVNDFVEGGSLAFLIRIKNEEILTSGSMNFIERELEGIHPDVAIIGAAPSRKNIYKYSERLMKVLDYPDVVLPTHWDDFRLPFSASQEEHIKELESFQEEILKASPDTRIIIPKYFEPITVPMAKVTMTKTDEK